MPPLEFDLEDDEERVEMARDLWTGGLVNAKKGLRTNADSPWLTRLREHRLRERAHEAHEERSEAAQAADESFNAPRAGSYAQWAAAPNRYDLPGVDTIPEERIRERAERRVAEAEAVGAVESWGTDPPEDLVEAGVEDLLEGQYDRKDRTVYVRDKADEEPEYPQQSFGYTLAHETAHAFDYHVGRRGQARSEALLGDEELREEATALSQRMRGFFGPDAEYRNNPKELVADSLASMMLEPRAARREAPLLTARLDHEILNPLSERWRISRKRERRD